MFLGIILLSVFTFGLGCVNYIQNNQLMVMMAIICRLGQGFFKIFAQVASFSIIVIVSKEEKEKYIAILESVMGLGISLGPIIGSLLYSFGGYFFTFAFMALMLLICSLFVGLTLPANIDEDNNETSSLIRSQVTEDNVVAAISYSELISDPMIIL